MASIFDETLTVITVAATYLLIVPVSYGTWGMLMMSSAIFNSLGKPVSSTIMSVVRMFVIYIPLAYLGKALFGLVGIFAAATVSNVIMGVVALMWNRKVYKHA